MSEQNRVEWTRSHSERRKDLQDIASWLDREKGIFAADAAAGNEPHLLHLPGLPDFRFTDLHYPEVITALLPADTWYWRESRGDRRVLTTDVIKHCRHQLMLRYCAARDEYRRKQGQAPKWGGIVPVSARSSCTLWEKKKQCLRDWDKSFTNGYNRTKSQHANPECSQCGGSDSIFHMCLRCPHAEIRDLRAKAFDEQATVLTEVLSKAPRWKRDLFAMLKSLAWPGDGVAPDVTEHLWRGLLSEDIQAHVPMVALHTQLTSEEELRDLRGDIRKFLEPLAYATQSMLSTRGRLYYAAPPTPVPAPAGSNSPARASRQRNTLLRMPGFILARTRRRIVRVDSSLKPNVYGKLQQTRIRLDRSANTSSSQAPPTMRLSTVQDLIETGWAARGISIPLVPGHASRGSQSSQASSAPSQPCATDSS